MWRYIDIEGDVTFAMKGWVSGLSQFWDWQNFCKHIILTNYYTFKLLYYKLLLLQIGSSTDQFVCIWKPFRALSFFVNHELVVLFFRICYHLYTSKRIWSHVYLIDISWYSFQSAQMPSSKVTIFCNEPMPWNVLLIFDATLGAKNYGANHLYPHVSYIFGKPWACSSTWWNPGWVIELENFD